MLIRDAEIFAGPDRWRRVDLRLRDGRIADIAVSLQEQRDEVLIDAAGALLLPGLHDQHLHLRALAAARASLACSPQQAGSAEALARRLHAASAGLPAGEWLRATGYHERVAGDIDRHWLDQHGPSRPLRLQHRGGRCWIFNSLGLRALGVDPDIAQDDPLERIDGRATGRLYDADQWLRARLPRRPMSLAPVSAQLARLGVTAVTDATPRNNLDEFAALAEAQRSGELLQDLTLMGDASLDQPPPVAPTEGPRLRRGATKFHLHDADLDDYDAVVERLRRSHRAGRAAAFHCVTRAELAFAVAAIDEAGVLAGDRIEHASVTPPDLFDSLRRLGLQVTVQANFVGERGDSYLDDVAADDRPWLYRLASFIRHGIRLRGSTDAPFGDADPWAAMRSAVLRRTPDGRALGLDEALTPEQALGLFCGTDAASIRIGARADLCLLDRPWSSARTRLSADDLRLVLKTGRGVWDRDALMPA